MAKMCQKFIGEDKNIVDVTFGIRRVEREKLVHKALHVGRTSCSAGWSDVPPFLSAMRKHSCLPSIHNSEIQLIKGFLKIDQGDVVLPFDTGCDILRTRERIGVH